MDEQKVRKKRSKSLASAQEKVERGSLAGAIVIGLYVLFPMLVLINLSLMSYSDALKNPVSIFHDFTFLNYVEVWDKLDVIKNTLITLAFTLIACVLNLIIVVLAAYPLARAHFRGSQLYVKIMMVTMLLPTTMIATIFITKYVFHIYSTPMALIYIWVTGGVQFNIFLAISSIVSLPKDLDEAAYMDGCGYFRCIFTIVVPLVKPVIATIFIFKAVSCWNDFMSPYIYAGSKIKTLSTGLFFYKGQYADKLNLLSTAVIIVAAPMVVVYCFFQKWIIAGLTSGAVKG